MNKIISYLGFAKKSNNCVTGQTALRKSNKHFNLIIACSSASENLKNLAKNLANKNNCEHIVLNDLEMLLHAKDIKIAGITDENLAKAITKEANLKE